MVIEQENFVVSPLVLVLKASMVIEQGNFAVNPQELVLKASMAIIDIAIVMHLVPMPFAYFITIADNLPEIFIQPFICKDLRY